MNIKTIITAALAFGIFGAAFAQSPQVSSSDQYKLQYQSNEKISFHLAGEKQTVAVQGKDGVVREKSFSYTASGNSISFLYLKDGANNSALAIDYPVLTVSGFGNTVTLDAIGAYQNNSQIYAGAGIGVDLIHHSGWDLKGIVGLKGFDLSKFTYTGGSQGFVYGLSVTIPFLSK